MMNKYLDDRNTTRGQNQKIFWVSVNTEGSNNDIKGRIGKNSDCSKS